jgi:Thrombospondin type 1 domain
LNCRSKKSVADLGADSSTQRRNDELQLKFDVSKHAEKLAGEAVEGADSWGVIFDPFDRVNGANKLPEVNMLNNDDDEHDEESLYSEEVVNSGLYSEDELIYSEEEEDEHFEDALKHTEEEEEAENYLENYNNEDDNKNEGWHVGPWSNCSAECGEGVRIR